MALSFLESLIPPLTAVPGVKIGLANIAIVFALYRLGPSYAGVISVLRVFLVGFAFGNAFSIAYSLAGAVLSFLVMLLLKKSGKFSITGVSIAGGVAHNVGQILIAALVMETTGIFTYLPVLLVSGIAAGICVGLVSALMLKRVPESGASTDERGKGRP